MGVQRPESAGRPAVSARVVVQLCFFVVLGIAEMQIRVRTPGCRRRRARPPRPWQLSFDLRQRQRSLHPAKISARERDTWVKLRPGWDSGRPRTRGDCVDGPRPCPYVGCRQHLYVSVNSYGSIKLNHPSVPPDQMHLLADTCALDVADRVKTNETMPLEAVGQRLGMTLERARQIQELGLKKLRVLMTANTSAEEDDAENVAARLRGLR